MIDKLPSEVIQLIAGHLSFREWARVSATCKEWWTLPLTIVDMSRGKDTEEPLNKSGIQISIVK